MKKITQVDGSLIFSINSKTYYKALLFLDELRRNKNINAAKLLDRMIKDFEKSFGHTHSPIGNYIQK